MGITEIYNEHKWIKNVLDIGCYIGSWNYEITPEWRIVCLEPYFHDHIKKPFPSNCVLLKKNFFEYEPDRKFDLIICKFVIEHQTSREQAKRMISKISWALASGGLAYFALPQGHSLSNTIYKAYFNIKLKEGLKSAKDGGHFVDYDRNLFWNDCVSCGLEMIGEKIHRENFDEYPYNLFKGCIEFYRERGIDLRGNNMEFLCRKVGG